MRNSLSVIKNILTHIVVLAAVYILAVLGFSRWINQTAPSMAENMSVSTFPLIYMQNNGVNYNCLHGYDKEMDVNYIRDTLTVLPDNHEMNIQIQPFNTNIESVSYEVLTLDGSSSLENTNVINMEESGGYVNARMNFQNNMLLGQEYILKIQVSAGGRNIFYYTRLLLEDGLHLDSYLDFVTGFYAKCVNKTDQQSLGTVVEPDETTDVNSSLARMDIHDSVYQLMWGELNPQIYYKPTPSLVDINGTTASFVLNYRISAVNEKGVSEIYNVKEFYRMRYTDTRVFLLDFTRSTEEIFSGGSSALESAGINLGISSGDVEFLFDDSKKVVAFVRENVLWSYRVNSGRMTRIFGFPQQENMDYRDFYDQNSIKILKVKDSGDVWFTVAGYMNRGAHEGENGIGIYYYEEASSTVEEILFVETMEAYDMLKLDIDDLAYVTENEKDCFILLEGKIYRIGLERQDYEVIAENVNNGCFAGSETNRYFSWLEEGSRYESHRICSIDFETLEIQTIESKEGDVIRPICYLEEDLVYGSARESEVDAADEGNELYPMYQLVIVNPDGDVVKTYEPDGIYVLGITQSNHMLLLSRAVKQGTGYVETTEDHIVNTNMVDDVEYGIATRAHSTKQNEILLRLGSTISDSNAQVVTSKLLVSEGSRSIQIPSNTEKEKLYYVYAGGRMKSRWPTAAEAIREADAQVGVVINDAKEFVWERGNKAESSKIKLENIPSPVRKGIMDVEELEKALGKDVISLKGCSLEQVLYFVGQKRPVLAQTQEGVVIITGYDDYGNLILLKPGEEETYFYGPKDSLALFEAAGNHFVTYLNTDV